MYKEWKSFCLLNDKLHHLVIRCPNVDLVEKTVKVTPKKRRKMTPKS